MKIHPHKPMALRDTSWCFFCRLILLKKCTFALKKGMIYWFTGQPSSGKTTLATLLVSYFEEIGDAVKHIDGDGLRQLTQNFDYTEKGRRSNIKRAQEIAIEYVGEDRIVIVSVVAPYRDLREALKTKTKVLEFYTHTSEKREKDHYHVENYEAPILDFVDVNTDESIDESFRKIVKAVKIKNQYSMFVGRYQPLHDGHKWLFEQRLKEGKNIMICVRDMIKDENNPYAAELVKQNIIAHFSKEVIQEKVKVIIIPDIESINYGRGVGYDVIEHKPPEQISQISATKIRALQKNKKQN